MNLPLYNSEQRYIEFFFVGSWSSFQDHKGLPRKVGESIWWSELEGGNGYVCNNYELMKRKFAPKTVIQFTPILCHFLYVTNYAISSNSVQPLRRDWATHPSLVSFSRWAFWVCVSTLLDNYNMADIQERERDLTEQARVMAAFSYIHNLTPWSHTDKVLINVLYRGGCSHGDSITEQRGGHVGRLGRHRGHRQVLPLALWYLSCESLV